MDAQNATDSDQTKLAGSASEQPEQSKSSGAKSPKSSAPKVRPQSPTIESKPDSSLNNGVEDRDSDAETIVLPGKDGHSPSKARAVRQEDRSDNDGDASKDNGSKRRREDIRENQSRGSRVDGVPGDLKKKKRPSGSHDKERLGLSKDGSSGLSSAPTSPSRQRLGRRRSMNSSLSLSDSEERRQKPALAVSKSSLRDKFKTGDRLLPPKRKAPRTDSEDDEDHRKARRPRTTSASLDNSRASKEHRAHPSKQDPHHNRSTSPPHRMHRRSVSTQLPSQSSNGSTLKKKRHPPPLHSTDYNSDESSASGSPYPQHTKLRNLATPSTTESNLSPAKVPSHKKHLDAHGQTLLARACARGEYDSAKNRLKERPEDLNVADYAGNTPLQIAAINGCEDIVKLLIDAGCNLDCVNYDKDTPLLDAVDNGHLGVVKLLLDAGVNPRKANMHGEEPIDRVTEDTDNADEIRAALVEAKKRFGGRTKTSEDRNSHGEYHESRDPHGPESPRHSNSAQASNRRAGTVRATKTRNDLLYMPLDDKTLRQAAGRGDEETVARILQVKENCDDAESMVAAARGGHDLVIQLLLGLGGAAADSEPVASQPEEFATPMLAAIGQENIKVVELLLEQQNFDPTRRFKGETYYEIAKRRQGTNWREEEDKLKKAYDRFKSSHKPKAKSPGKKDRDREREEKRARREERAESARPHKRNNPSPTGDNELRRKASAKLSSPKERKKSEPHAAPSEENRLKRGAVRQREEKTSDREVSPSLSHKTAKTKRAESELAAISSEGETMKPRRKLVSKGELRGERDKNRRSSMASNASFKEPSSPHETRNEDPVERQKLSEKYHDRAKALKRDESKDRPLGLGDHSGKRHRASLTPDRPSNGEKEDGEKPAKRQRLESDSVEKKQKRRTSDEHPRKPSSNNDITKSNVETKKDPERDAGRKHANKPPRIHDTIRIKSEDLDVEMINVDQGADDPEPRDEEAEDKKAALAKKAKEEEEVNRKLAEAEEEKRKQAEAEAARKKKEAEEAEKRKLEEQRLAEKKRQEEEEARLRAEEEARRAAEERARQEAEEKKKLEEAKRKQEEEERKKREAEEERRRQEEEERLRKEREAAEEARRKREEEERLERERRERLQREELERKRAAREAEQRRIREEQDRARLNKLPPLLRWLDTCPNPKTGVFAEKFKTLQGARYDCINTDTNQTPEGREQWVLNTHVALLLGEKDLDLTRYASWERIPVSSLAKKSLWRIEKGFYSLLSPKMLDLGQQLPGYYGNDDANELDVQAKQRLQEEAWERFRDLNMFFVKLSDFLYTVPTIPHLRNLKIAVTYRELLETEEQARRLQSMQKWKHDPDANRFGGVFAPRNKYYIDGSFVGEDKPERAETSNTPFPEPRVPRRGLMRVLPTDPEHDRICMEQGLDHLVKGKKSPSLPNGVHTPPASHSDAPTATSPGETAESRVHNGTHDIPETHSTTNGDRVNGVNGTVL